MLLCIVFAMLEEAVTTGLTNIAPLLGGVTDAARITVSKNYFVVVFTNSVIVFVPLFLCWGWLLSRYDFRPIEVLLLFGLTYVLVDHDALVRGDDPARVVRRVPEQAEPITALYRGWMMTPPQYRFLYDALVSGTSA